MQSLFSRALVAILCGLVAMNYYIMAIEPLRPYDQKSGIYTFVVGICIYLIVYAVLSKLNRSRPNKKL